MKIILSEKQLDKVLKNTNSVNEQDTNVDDQKILIVLQNKINDLIDKKEKEILDKSSIKIVTDKDVASIKIGDKTYSMEPMIKGIYALIVPPNSVLLFDGAPMASLTPDIEKIPEYKTLSEKHPELKNQIQTGFIKGMLFTDEQNQGIFKLTITRKPTDPKDIKSAVQFGTEYPLGEFLERNKLIYKFKSKTTNEVRYGTLESGQILTNLSSVKLSLTPDQPIDNINASPRVLTIKTLDLQDLFNFNNSEFKNAQQINQQLGGYIQEIKGYTQRYGQSFIDAYKSKNPTVLGYSSVDGDPDQQIVGDYKPCAGNKTRRDYDLCLSHERARKIADELNKALPELGGAIKFKGMGETTKWGPGWTKESPTIPEKTAPNRRYVLSSVSVPLPQQQV